MILSDSLQKSNILVKIKSKTRWDLIDEMLTAAEKSNLYDPQYRDNIKKSLIEREKSMSTGIGNGVAIPHCTTPLVKEMAVVLAVSQEGIDFDSIDNELVKIIILLLVPKNKLTQHIKTLANIAKIMSNEEIRKKILTLKSAEAIIEEIKNYQS